MRSHLLLVTIALVAVQFTQVFCRPSSDERFESAEESWEKPLHSAESVFIEESSHEIAQLAKANGLSKKTITQGLVLVAKIKELNLWDHLTTIEQERLRVAIIKNTPVPSTWKRLTSYEEFINPENAGVLQKLVDQPALRKAKMAALPSLPNEQEVIIASSSWWWKSLKDCQKKTLARYILRGYPQPAGFHSWNEAVYATNRFGKWIVEKKDEILSTEC